MKIISQPQWAFSAEKRPIALHQSHEKLTQPLLFIGGVHGDEPEGVALAEGLLSWLSDEKTLANEIKPQWALIPCLNPDGYLYGHRWNGNKVDLNRNYPSKNWSPHSKGERYYPGPHPGSEPEIQSLVQWIQTHRPQMIIHFHSWDPCIVYTGEPGKKVAELIAKVTGYKAQNDIGYPTPGSLSQYGWNDNKIPVICTEEQNGIARETVWPRFKEAFIDMLTRPEAYGLH